MYIQIVSFPLLVGCLLHKQWLKTSNITPQQLHNRVCGTKFVIICGHYLQLLHSRDSKIRSTHKLIKLSKH